MKQKIFISSVQSEFKPERQALKNYIHGDALLNRFFDVFIFEDLPASERHPNKAYIEKAKNCDVYLGLFGNEYGSQEKKKISPTHEEFLTATKFHKPRLVFIKGNKDSERHPGMRALVKEAGKQVIRRRFFSTDELILSIYASLVNYLATKDLLRSGPFDATICEDAYLKDLSAEKIHKFVRMARSARGFPLSEDTSIKEVLEHLNLLRKGKLTYAAMLLFGKQPQRFLISSEVKCAHFHGKEVSKPIPFYQVYKGTVFELTDQALNFVLSKIDLAVGTRAKSVQVPVAYEIPPDVIREAIVNAVAHRDYTSNGSIQVMLFSDRLEVWNPGTLPLSLTLDKLRKPHSSVPANPLLAESLYLAKYIERMGTGTRDMIHDCKKAGLAEPEFNLTDGFVATVYRKPGHAFEVVGGKRQSDSPTQSIDPVIRLLEALRQGEKKASELRAALKIKHRPTFRSNYLHPALKEKLIEYTNPNSLNSHLQKYRLTKKGKEYLKTRLPHRM